MSEPRSSSSLFEPAERAAVVAAVLAGFANPFAPGARGHDGAETHQYTGVNCRLHGAGFTPLVELLRDRLAGGRTASGADLVLYQDACLLYLCDRYGARFCAIVGGAEGGAVSPELWRAFGRDHHRLFGVAGPILRWLAAGHLFAVAYQIGRAFHCIASSLVGGSRLMAALRAAVWQSIFTHDLGRYVRGVHEHMVDVPLLVTGPTGTGKELVARAVGLTRCIPWDPDRLRFAADPAGTFRALNLSALSPTLIESELFGHARGAFTGATTDKPGWFEACTAIGTLFLDEIGELEVTLQTKLLRVLQTRVFQRIADIDDRPFAAKLVAAPHRDLAERIRANAFRSDLYHRLAADVIVTPSLRAQLDDAPDDLPHLVRHLAARAAGAAEADALGAQVEAWIKANLRPDYPWLGNVRELEQCVRSIMVSGTYRPFLPPLPSLPPPSSQTDSARVFDREARAGNLSLEEMSCRYTTLVYAKTGNSREAAARLKVDRRVVMRRVDRGLLGLFKGRLLKRPPRR